VSYISAPSLENILVAAFHSFRARSVIDRELHGSLYQLITIFTPECHGNVSAPWECAALSEPLHGPSQDGLHLAGGGSH
jgi:hypothetical protein